MGIDLGSTSLKAVVYDLNGRCLASSSRRTERFHPEPRHPEWTVWEPRQIWDGTAAAIRHAVALLDDPRKIRAVAVTGMGMDGLPIDAEGHWLYPMISWHDPRTAPQYDWWLANIGAAKVFSIGGNPLWAINSALRVRWIAENEPAIYQRTDKWLLIEDFLNFMLTGRRVTDYSMASCTALFDQQQLDWSDELLALAELPRNLFCEALPSGTPIGTVQAEAARHTGLAEGTPVVLGGHDHICGALPVGAFEPGVVLNVLGTWETVMTSTARPVLKDELRAAGMTVQAHVAPQHHAIWGGNVAGEMLEWYRRQFVSSGSFLQETAGASWEMLLAEAAEAPPGARGAMFLPHLSGAASPVVDPHSLGAMVGLSAGVGRGDFLRAIIEGLNYQSAEMVAALEGALDQPLEHFVAVGGGTRNTLWMQNKADMLGRNVEVPGVEEATPLGAAILAGLGAGVYRDVHEAYQRVRQPGRVYQPDADNHARYTTWRQTYRQLYPAVRPVSHALFDTFLAHNK